MVPSCGQWGLLSGRGAASGAHTAALDTGASLFVGLSHAGRGPHVSSPPPRWSQHAKFVAVTSFLCLRFFSPAVMTPKLFQLRDTHADARTSRTLLLLAKVRQGTPGRGSGVPGCFLLGTAGSPGGDAATPGALQAIQLVGNMEPAAGRAKETWLSPLLPALQQGTARMRDFITRLVGTEEDKGEEEGEGRPLGPPPAVVKEGLLLVPKTRGKGPLLAAAAGKKLHFCLTGESLSFGKSPSAEVGGCWRGGGVAAGWH